MKTPCTTKWNHPKTPSINHVPELEKTWRRPRRQTVTAQSSLEFGLTSQKEPVGTMCFHCRSFQFPPGPHGRADQAYRSLDGSTGIVGSGYPRWRHSAPRTNVKVEFFRLGTDTKGGMRDYSGLPPHGDHSRTGLPGRTAGLRAEKQVR